MYPERDGKYVVERALLPEKVKDILRKIESLDFMARDLRQEAGEAGKRLADAYDKYRDAQVPLLWTMAGLEPPAGVGFDRLLII